MNDNLSDVELTARLQRAAFGYFSDLVLPQNGLVPDTSRPDSPCSIAVVGFALSCYPIAVERGWMERRAAAELTLTTLRFFWYSPQNDAADATGYKGFFYHFLDMQHGRRVWRCELSLIDTALLLAGILTVSAYFDGSQEEGEIREMADALYRRVDWTWALNGGATLAQGWKPESGFLHYGWEGYNEATILYVLALGSPYHELPETIFGEWTYTYQWENLLDIDLLYSGPLFTHLFSHAWLDFRGIRDLFMRSVDSDYFRNTQHAIAIQREYCARNPGGYEGYSRDLWGITAGDGPSNEERQSGHRDLRFFGYMSRGVPYGPDDGTVAPWAMLACLPFDREAALAGTRHLLTQFPQALVNERFLSGLNPTLHVDGGCWMSKGHYGLDQGLLVMMIENARSGLAWKLMRGNSNLRRGLKRAGFDGGWLSDGI